MCLNDVGSCWREARKGEQRGLFLVFSIIGLVCVEAAAFLRVSIFRAFHGSFSTEFQDIHIKFV